MRSRASEREESGVMTPAETNIEHASRAGTLAAARSHRDVSANSMSMVSKDHAELKNSNEEVQQDRGDDPCRDDLRERER